MSKDVGNHDISFPCTLENIVKTGSQGPIFDFVRDLSWLSSSGSLPNDFTCCDELLDLFFPHHMPEKGNLAFRYSPNYPSFRSGSIEYFFISHFINPFNFQHSPEESHLSGHQSISFCGHQRPSLSTIQ